MKLKKYISIVLIVFLFAGCGKTDQQPEQASGELISLIENQWESPHQLILGEFEKNPVVVLGCPVFFTESAALLQYLVPVMYDNDIKKMGIWFADKGSRDLINKFLTVGPESARTANRILFNFNPAWGYEEYRDFLIYVRNFNSRLKEEEAPFSLIPLSDEGILSAGEILENENRILLAVPVEEAYKIKSEHKEIPVVILHGPVKKEGRNNAFNIPAKGIIENVLPEVRPEYVPAGLPVNDYLAGFFPTGKKPDGYIILGPADQFTVISPIDDFIDRSNRAAAIQRFPVKISEKMEKYAVRKMNRYIRQKADNWKKAMEKL